MREDPADKGEIHAFRGVSGSISWLAGQTRPDVSCQLSNLQQTLPQLTVAQVCASSMVVRRVHQYADLGLKIRRTPARCVIEQWRFWLAHRAATSVVFQTSHCWKEGSRTVPSSLGAEAQANVCGFGLCRVSNAVSAGIDSWTIRSTGCSGGHAGETSGMCYRLQELVRSSVSCGKPVNAARQTISHRCADHSRVREEDRLCDTLGTDCTTVGRRSHER